MILGIRTDGPVLRLVVSQADGTDTYSEEFEDARELEVTILRRVAELLTKRADGLTSISGVVCYAGPGSFTGLRIGHTVANGLAYGLSVPIVSKAGEEWFEAGVYDLAQGVDAKVVKPEYGGEANITAPKK